MSESPKDHENHDAEQNLEDFDTEPDVFDSDSTLPQKTRTGIISTLNRRRRSQDNNEAPRGTVTFGDQHEVILVVRGIVERIFLPDDQSIIIGRSDARMRYHADVDLTPYGALDRGVSREHARLYVEDGYLYIVDMGSTNGTFLGDKRLEPHIPAVLRKGDDLMLGRLPLQILFR